MAEEAPPRRACAREASHDRRLRRGAFRRQFVLGRRYLKVFELRFQLIEQTVASCRAHALQFVAQLVDLQLEMSEQLFVVASPGLQQPRRVPPAAAPAAYRHQREGARHRSSPLEVNHEADPLPTGIAPIRYFPVGTWAAGYASRCRRSCRPTAQPRSPPNRGPTMARRSGPAPIASHRATARCRHATAPSPAGSCARVRRQVAPMRIAAQPFLDDERQADRPLPRGGVATRNPDANPLRQRNHRNARSTVITSGVGAVDSIRTVPPSDRWFACRRRRNQLFRHGAGKIAGSAFSAAVRVRYLQIRLVATSNRRLPSTRSLRG